MSILMGVLQEEMDRLARQQAAGQLPTTLKVVGFPPLKIL